MGGHHLANAVKSHMTVISAGEFIEGEGKYTP
jgi:hypothetical protein